MTKALPAPYALGTFSIAGGTPFAALVLDEHVLALQAIPRLLPQLRGHFGRMESTLQLLEDWDRTAPALADAAGILRTPQYADAFRKLAAPVGQLHAHPPVASRQIFAVGANYREHVVAMTVKLGLPGMENMGPEERRKVAEATIDARTKTGMPFVFPKTPSALAGADDPLVIPEMADQCDWEIELAVVVGKPARHVAAADAMDYVAGYAIFNDVSARGLESRPDAPEAGRDWMSCKSQPGFAPLGPYLVPRSAAPPVDDLQMVLKLNGEVKQDGNTSDMLFKIDRVIEFLSSRVQLLPGDVISTGSPPGNGAIYGRFLQPGDVMELSITGLGTQRTVCIAEQK